MSAVHTPPPVVLTLDLGSSGVKGAAFDTQGRSLAGLEVQEPFALRYAPGRVAEVPLPNLIAAAETVLDRLHQRLGNRPVLAVALGRGSEPNGPALS